MMRNRLFVLSGPSGVGKGTLAKMLCARRENVELSVSCTTRTPRGGEKDGREYFFLTHEQFENKINERDFLEYSEHFGNLYGTLKSFVTEKLSQKDVLLEIDVNGGLSVRKVYPDAVLIMVMPPSTEELKRRLFGRNTEKEAEIETRMKRIEYEINQARFYDYTVVNDNLEDAVLSLEKIIETEKKK